MELWEELDAEIPLLEDCIWAELCDEVDVDISLLDAPSDRPRIVGEPEAGRAWAPNESATLSKSLGQFISFPAHMS